MRRATPAAALAMVTLMASAACEGGSGISGDPGEAQSIGAGGTAVSGRDPDAEAPLTIPEGAEEGGTLSVQTASVPSSFDPTLAQANDAAILSNLVTRSLTQYVYRDGSMVLVPDMATDLGRPGKDNTEWTFTLREGLKYEDGSVVRAEDVAYAIKRSFAVEELPGGPTYNQRYFLEGDTYNGPISDGDDYGGVVVSGNDITIKMRRPFADMDHYASFPAFTAIPQEKDDPASYGQHPLATGPYKFADYAEGSSLSLVKNDQWEAGTDPGRIQMVAGWEFEFGQDPVESESAIVNDTGSGQTTLTYDDVSPATYRTMQAQGGDRLVVGALPCTSMWYLDMRRIKEIEVRQALGWAYPYKDAWRAAGELVGLTRQGGTSILPPGTAGQKDFDPLGNKGTETDPTRSRELLREAGYGPGDYEIKWYFRSDDASSVDVKDAVVQGLEAAGFKASPIVSTSDTVRNDESDDAAPINVVANNDRCSDWPTGGGSFPTQWHGELVGQEGRLNPSMINEPALDNEQDRIQELSAEAAADAWGEFDEKVMTEYYPAINTGFSGQVTIHGSAVGGMEHDNVRGMPTFAQMYVAQ